MGLEANDKEDKRVKERSSTPKSDKLSDEELGIRRRKATELLRYSDFTIPEIAEKCGLSRKFVTDLRARCAILGILRKKEHFVVKYKNNAHNKKKRCPICGALITTTQCVACRTKHLMGGGEWGDVAGCGAE